MRVSVDLGWFGLVGAAIWRCPAGMVELVDVSLAALKMG